MNKSVFIIGSPRSGTTFVANLLRMNESNFVDIEPDPKFHKESRLYYETRNKIYLKYFSKQIKASIDNTAQNNLVYVSKSPNYLSFVNELVEQFNAQIIFVIRDGKEAVCSMMDWNTYHSKSFFHLAEDWPNNSQEVCGNESFDSWDFSRFRPKKADPIFMEWKKLSRFEKCAWYWSKFNSILLNYYDKYKLNSMLIHADNISYDLWSSKLKKLDLDVNSKIDFEKCLNSKRKKNSVESRFSINQRFLKPSFWNTTLNNQFDKLAGSVYRDCNERRKYNL